MIPVTSYNRLCQTMKTVAVIEILYWIGLDATW